VVWNFIRGHVGRLPFMPIVLVPDGPLWHGAWKKISINWERCTTIRACHQFGSIGIYSDAVFFSALSSVASKTMVVWRTVSYFEAI
jgi:hypothetical protein